MSYRKAKYLIDIYEALIRSGVDDEKFGCLSWCKWREIAGVIIPENVDEWIAPAREKTVAQLREAVKASNQFYNLRDATASARIAKRKNPMSIVVVADMRTGKLMIELEA
jgi:hypothetical protein